MSTIFSLKNVAKNYDGNEALRDINLDIQKGEIFSIIGPNGAGKTTLLHIIGLLREPAKGEIKFKGSIINKSNSSDYRKKITMVFQQPVLFNSTVFDNVGYGLKIRGNSEEEIVKKVGAALESVGMSNFSHKKAKKLSVGEQQRVVLARALALNPELLLLDEPTANLDPKNSILVENIIKKMRGKTTVVITTHNLFQARRISDRVACLLGGEIIDVGKTKDIFSRPTDERTKKFIRGEFF